MAIESRLFKAGKLIYESRYFTILVRVACAIAGVEFTEPILVTCASNPAIQDKIPLTFEQDVDVELFTLLGDPTRATALDNDLTYVVNQMKGQAA